jgi:branched-chain amino acid transport system substrate-binding protein
MRDTQRKQSTGLILLAIVAILGCVTVAGPVEAAEPVKVGFATSLSGIFTQVGTDLLNGFKLYMEEIGHKAGGRDIKVIVGDIGSGQVNRAVQKVTSMIQEDSIDILAGVVHSGSANALARLAKRRDLPFVIANAGSDGLTQQRANPLLLRVSYSNSQGMHFLGSWAYDQGYRKAVVIAWDFVAGYEHIGGFCRTFTRAGGQIIQEIWTPLKVKDFKPFLEQINPEADVVVAFFGGLDALRFVTQYSKYGLKSRVPLLGYTALVDDSILQKEGQAAEGIITATHWALDVDTPENKKFIKAYQQKYGRKPSIFAEQGYVTGMFIAEALKNTKGEVKGAEFVKVMRGIKVTAPRGLIEIDKYGAPIQAYRLQKVVMEGGAPRNVVIQTAPSVSQFWTWNPKEYMSMDPYGDLKDAWAE